MEKGGLKLNIQCVKMRFGIKAVLTFQAIEYTGCFLTAVKSYSNISPEMYWFQGTE